MMTNKEGWPGVFGVSKQWAPNSEAMAAKSNDYENQYGDTLLTSMKMST